MEVRLATVGFPEAPAVGLSAQPPQGLQGNRAEQGCPRHMVSPLPRVHLEKQKPLPKGQLMLLAQVLTTLAGQLWDPGSPQPSPNSWRRRRELFCGVSAPPPSGSWVRLLQPGSTLMGRDSRGRHRETCIAPCASAPHPRAPGPTTPRLPTLVHQRQVAANSQGMSDISVSLTVTRSRVLITKG